MPFTFASGQNIDSGSGLNHVKLLASVPAGACLHEVNVQGECFDSYIANAVTSGVFPSLNLSAGIQYGAIGHVPSGITDGTATGETWLTFSDGIPPTFLVNWVAGTSPTNVMERASFALNARWRGTLFLGSGADIHWELGENDTDPSHFNFKLDYTWWVGWST